MVGYISIKLFLKTKWKKSWDTTLSFLKTPFLKKEKLFTGRDRVKYRQTLDISLSNSLTYLPIWVILISFKLSQEVLL